MIEPITRWAATPGLTRAEADLALARKLCARLPFYAAAVDVALKPALMKTLAASVKDELTEMLEMLEAAAGRLMLRNGGGE